MRPPFIGGQGSLRSRKSTGSVLPVNEPMARSGAALRQGDAKRLCSSGRSDQSPVVKSDNLLPPPESRWTRIDDYLVALAKGRTARRRRAERLRTQPEEPHPMLSTVPFVVLLAALALVAAAIAIDAWPGDDGGSTRFGTEADQPGTAPANWFDEAKKDIDAERRR